MPVIRRTPGRRPHRLPDFVVNDRIQAVREFKRARPSSSMRLTTGPHLPGHRASPWARRKDITLVTGTAADALGMFEERRIDAMVVAPPFAQSFARKVGRVLVDTTKDGRGRSTSLHGRRQRESSASTRWRPSGRSGRS